MTTIRGMLEKVQSVNVRDEAINIIRSTEKQNIDLNRKQLYQKSIDSEGNNLRLYSSALYALEKERRNPLPGFMRPDLYNTGAFQLKFFAVVTSKDIVYGSSDVKSSALEAKYGGKIFGLTKENKAIYSLDVVYPLLQNVITQKTGLKFK